ncbi:hypothetical protein HNV11_10085 [Spirosoma taeanense]|uniref:Uncharacterized protein n=1 Tax=Spirosoma taeanense TaxID=2735870 RepID=A0A6M5Y918_9BACT|nr:hypothetical protein [Spirosoma taeanense]QJW89703.1 hypothetical protein HNV11_10085 [Spirosoma taeanense]
MARVIFGGIIAVLLLGLYAYAIIYAILAVYCSLETGCTDYPKNLNEGINTVLTLVGGLVSALVVAELAITKPGDTPTARLLNTGSTPTANKTVGIIAVVYIAVWLVCGVASLIVGYLQYPDVVPVLTASAKGWLGLAVAAAYSYLGVK